MKVTEFLIELVKYTDGWVIVVVFGLYVGYHVYVKYSENTALSKTLNILETTLKSLLERIDLSVNTLVTKVDLFVSRTRNSE